MRTWKISLIVVAVGAIATFADPALGKKPSTDYPDLVNSLNPIAYWRFNDPNSVEGHTAADSSAGGTHDGIYHNGVTLITSDLPGPGSGGKAASFDGDNDYIDSISDTGFPTGDADRSFVTWVKYDPDQLNYGYNGIFGYGTLGTYGAAFGVAAYNANDGHVPNGALGVSQQGASVGTDPIEDGQWHFLAVSVENSNYRVYLDGAFVREKVMTTNTILDPTWVRINSLGDRGGPSGGDQPLDCLLDEMALFGTVLTDQNIVDLYNAIPEPATLGLLLMGGLALLSRRRK